MKKEHDKLASPFFLGIDFTSVPSRRKPITCARARFSDGVLRLDQLDRWRIFEDFEKAMLAPGPWVAGIDFPFGQSRRFVENIGWPQMWAEYVNLVGTMDRASFRNTLEDYKKDRSAGDKQHKRACDVITRSQSPQTLHYTPVGLMFFEGAKRLVRAGVHLPHNHDGDGSRVVLEAYPGIAARQLIGDRSYKSDSKKKQTEERHRARVDLLKLLTGAEGKAKYGFEIDVPQEIVNDPGADDLDAFICAVQAAWGWIRKSQNYGAPNNVDRLEGWICDPALLQGQE